MLGALGVKAKAVGVILGHHGIVGADFFDEAAIPGAPRIRHHNAIEGAFLGAASGKSNFESHAFASFCFKGSR
jgi:hypothetical protein